MSAVPVNVRAPNALPRDTPLYRMFLSQTPVRDQKDAPSYKEIAAKLRGKPDAEQKLYTHLTTNPKVKVDGKEERHDSLKTKNEADVRNVIGWVLSR